MRLLDAAVLCLLDHITNLMSYTAPATHHQDIDTNSDASLCVRTIVNNYVARRRVMYLLSLAVVAAMVSYDAL